MSTLPRARALGDLEGRMQSTQKRRRRKPIRAEQISPRQQCPGATAQREIGPRLLRASTFASSPRNDEDPCSEARQGCGQTDAGLRQHNFMLEVALDAAEASLATKTKRLHELQHELQGLPTWLGSATGSGHTKIMRIYIYMQVLRVSEAIQQ